ncbi:MAG TPA: hypothetical protein VFD84_15200 [Candidatus Binatia bacterium]|jgi:hypothetical protein|nr:hypothetical protein [Candidatus Binatia bacterium]
MDAIRSLSLVAGIVAAASIAAARPARRSRGPVHFDPSTVTTLSGEVLRVEHVASPRGRGTGVHLVLKTDTETIPVSLGPDWYVGKAKLKVGPGDRVVVKGSRTTLGGEPAIVAQELKKGDETLTLRDDRGVPLWSGGRGAGRR